MIRQVYDQQRGMYRHQTRRCDDRMVSISQPDVRPIDHGKRTGRSNLGRSSASASPAKGWRGWIICVGMPLLRGKT